MKIFRCTKMRVLQAEKSIKNSVVAKRTKKSLPTIISWRKGRTEPKLKDIPALLKALKCKESDLFE